MQLSKPLRMRSSGNSRRRRRGGSGAARRPSTSAVVTLQHHVNALEDVAVVVVVEGEDALRAQDLAALDLHQVLEPRHEHVRIERFVTLERQRLHVLIVIVLQAMAMIMVMVVVAVMIMVVVVVNDRRPPGNPVRSPECGRGRMRRGRARRPAPPSSARCDAAWHRVDGADAGLDLGKLGLGGRDRSC